MMLEAFCDGYARIWRGPVRSSRRFS